VRHRLGLVVLLLAAACRQPEPPGTAEGDPLPGSDFEGPAFELEQVLPEIYHARGTGAVAVGANAAIIINDDDVLIVDSHVSPAAAQALLDELAAVTDKPVRYVVNTHYHFDHAHGNQIYPPDVQVIGHELTREMLASGASKGRAFELFIGPLPQAIADLRRQVAAAPDDSTRRALEERLA